MKWYNFEVAHIERLTEDSVRIDLVSKENGFVFDFKAGQYLTFLHTHEGEEIRRPYSICTSANEDRLSVGIKEVKGGRFSSYANRVLKVGDTLKVAEPDGSFLNPSEDEDDKDYVFFTAGSGITPILSLIKTILETSKKSTISLFYGNKNARSVMFLEELESLKNQYTTRFSMYHILSRQAQDSELFNGRIDAEKISMWEMLFDIKNTSHYFLCGPEKMILGVKQELESRGVDSKRIHFELFTSGEAEAARKEREAIVESEDESKKAVTIILDGKEILFDFSGKDDNVLDRALEEGADLPFACKGGVCATCKGKLVEGEVDMYVNYGLEQDEVERGFILTCQSYPKSDHIVVNFDEV